MPKKKKHIRLPNGYGSIRFIGKGRTLPYAVHPPARERNAKGEYIKPKALCYVPDWYTGFAVLSAYHAGNYKPGMELDLIYDRSDIDGFCRKVMAHSIYQDRAGTPLENVYKSFIDFKFGENAAKKMSSSARRAYDHGWSYLQPLGSRPIERISIDDLQQIVNECPHKRSTKEQIVMVAKQIFKFAMQREICEKNPAQYLVVPDGEGVEHGVPFSDEEISRLWKLFDDKNARTLLMMIYSGFRIGELHSLEIHVKEGYFKGGIKTKAGKDRIVPIHSAVHGIANLSYGYPEPNTLRARLTKFMNQYGFDHTPHDCRHTFSALCERYGVNEADRKRMMGHSFGADITNGVYGHRTLEDLRNEIEKIKVVHICDH